MEMSKKTKTLALFVKNAPVISAVLGLYFFGFGIFAIVAPGDWFSRVPPAPNGWVFNPHLIRDIGIAFLTAGAGCISAAIFRQHGQPLLILAGIFTGGHALFHLTLFFVYPEHFTSGQIVRESLGAIVPGFLPFVLATAFKPFPKSGDAEPD